MITYINIRTQAIKKATFKSVDDPLDFSGIYFAKITVLFDILELLFMKFPWPDLIDSSSILLWRGAPIPKGIFKYLRSSL